MISICLAANLVFVCVFTFLAVSMPSRAPAERVGKVGAFVVAVAFAMNVAAFAFVSINP